MDDGERPKKKDRTVSSSLAGVSAAAVPGGSERSGQALQSVAAASSASQTQAAISAASRVSMSHIQGVKKQLVHANSFTGQVPKYGVETSLEEELGKVLCSLGYVGAYWNRFECVSQRERVRSMYGIIYSSVSRENGGCTMLPLPFPYNYCNYTSVSGMYKYCVFTQKNKFFGLPL